MSAKVQSFIEYEPYEQRLEFTRSLNVDIKELYTRYNISSSDITLLTKKFHDKTLDFNPWSFNNACYFALWIQSTIGYGFWMPDTWSGELLCLLSIPITVLFLVACYRYSLSIMLTIETVLEHNPRIQGLVLGWWRPFHVVVLLFIYFIAYQELGWSMWDCIYFVFMSNTTIGMTPKYPEKKWNPIMGAFIFHCFMVNVGYALEVLERIQNQMKNNLLKVEHCVKETNRLAEARKKLRTLRYKEDNAKNKDSVRSKLREERAAFMQEYSDFFEFKRRNDSLSIG